MLRLTTLLVALSTLFSGSDACMALFTAAGNTPVAEPLVAGTPVQGSITTTTGFATPGSGVDPTCGTATTTTPSRIYSWVAAADGQVNFSTGDNTCTRCFDSVISAWYDDAAGACTQADCDDDGGPGSRDALITFDAVSGTTYYLVVNSYSSDDGCFNLCPGANTCPANSCQNTINICPTDLVFDDLPELTGDICETPNGSGEPLSYNGSLYRYTVPDDYVAGADNMYVYFASIVGTDDRISGVSDPTMDVWTGGCLPVGSNDDGFTGIGGSWVSENMLNPGDMFIIGSEALSSTGVQAIGTCMGYSADGVAPAESPCAACNNVYPCESDEDCLGWGSCTDEEICGASSLVAGLALLALN